MKIKKNRETTTQSQKFVLFVFVFLPSLLHHSIISTNHPPPFLGTEQLPYWLCEVLEQFSPISPFDSAERCFFQRSNFFQLSKQKIHGPVIPIGLQLVGNSVEKSFSVKKTSVEKIVMTSAKRPTPKSDLQFNTSKFGHFWHVFGFVTMWAFKLRNPNTPLTCLFGQFAMVVRYGFVWWIWVIV